jgi:N-acetylmuramoyl-L-alanine amidase
MAAPAAASQSAAAAQAVAVEPVTDPIAKIAAQSTIVPTLASAAGPASAMPAPAQPAAAKPDGRPLAKVDAPLVQAAPIRPARPLPSGTRPLVIAIDAGHGGQDPGAHGLNGTREKDVTLAIARELARQVNATPGMQAFLTRESDYFIPLPQRARKASANKADIFLSIHADAAENRGARGSSVYVLSTRGASSQRARWLADKENAADVIGGGRVRVADDTLASVLLDLTQSGNMRASEDAAGHVLGGLKRVGNNHKPEIERANFAVLRTSDKMPAMLVETAFISNPDEEKRLADPGFQRTLASAILDGIDRYFIRQPPPGTLYALRAKTAQDATATAASSAPQAVVGAGGSR